MVIESAGTLGGQHRGAAEGTKEKINKEEIRKLNATLGRGRCDYTRGACRFPGPPLLLGWPDGPGD